MRVVLRPVGRGRWRPLVLKVEGFPRVQGLLFRGNPYSAESIDADRQLVRVGDVWVIDGRSWRVAEVRK
jgi:hypothetical protein